MYPKSRYSVGMQVVERLSKTAKSGWFADPASSCHVSEAGLNVLAIPLTYLVHENANALRAAMKNRKMTINDIVVCSYSLEMEFGSMRLDDGGPTSGHLALEPICEMFQTEAFKRLSIGIAHPPNMGYNPDVLMSHDYDDQQYESFFLCNKFPEAEQYALDHVLLPAAEQLINSGEHNSSHTYSYREIMGLCERIKVDSIKKLQFEELKRAQDKEIANIRAKFTSQQNFKNRL